MTNVTERDISNAIAFAQDIEHQIACHADTLPEVTRRVATALVALAERNQPDWFAKELVEKLNILLENRDVARDIGKLIDTRVPCSDATANHRHISTYDGEDGPRLGVLGLLNGLLFLSEKTVCATFTTTDPMNPQLELFDLRDKP